MSAANRATGRAAVEQRLVRRAMADEAFRGLLLTDPPSAIREEFNIDPPADMTIEVMEETPDRLVVVLPMDLSAIDPAAVWAMTGRRPDSGS